MTEEDRVQIIELSRTVKRWILDGRLEGHWLKTPTGRYKVDLDAVLLLVSGNRALSFEPPLIVKTN